MLSWFWFWQVPPPAQPKAPPPAKDAVTHLYVTPDGATALYASADKVLTLFAVETDSFSIEPPHAEAVRDVNVAYWQSGWVAYVLSGTGDQKELLSLASRLSR